MTQSVDDFFGDSNHGNDKTASSPGHILSSSGRVLTLPQPSDLFQYADMIQGVQGSPFKPSTPLWEPEPTAFDDPHVLHSLKEDRTYLLLNKTTNRAFVRCLDLKVYAVRKVKREERVALSPLEEEGWLML